MIRLFFGDEIKTGRDCPIERVDGPKYLPTGDRAYLRASQDENAEYIDEDPTYIYVRANRATWRVERTALERLDNEGALTISRSSDDALWCSG